MFALFDTVLPFDQHAPIVSLDQNPQHIDKLHKYMSTLIEEAKQNIQMSQHK
jgi:hypothetical protein